MTIPIHPHCLHMATRSDGTPWWTAFPPPKATPGSISPEEVFRLLEEHQQSHTDEKQRTPKDFLLVDVRRTDFTGGTVSSAINIPAHGFYAVRGGLFGLCKQAGLRRVVFYCGEFEVQVRTSLRGC
ncbi:hypothetical protein QBC34DRAFT_414573 [Podospora aff. communis PSN243]|uniref:Rhodanese domain-containing protein n=1 Tax=Podospora aff. communis PSN243 TaxID=3040156 RepID=A0AAV9GBN9_9PEZI|nr:hypothetical protein QBC34DRAFT_414573 [Podospora aff. communis PSN243]